MHWTPRQPRCSPARGRRPPSRGMRRSTPRRGSLLGWRRRALQAPRAPGPGRGRARGPARPRRLPRRPAPAPGRQSCRPAAQAPAQCGHGELRRRELSGCGGSRSVALCRLALRLLHAPWAGKCGAEPNNQVSAGLSGWRQAPSPACTRLSSSKYGRPSLEVTRPRAQPPRGGAPGSPPATPPGRAAPARRSRPRPAPAPAVAARRPPAAEVGIGSERAPVLAGRDRGLEHMRAGACSARWGGSSCLCAWPRSPVASRTCLVPVCTHCSCAAEAQGRPTAAAGAPLPHSRSAAPTALALHCLTLSLTLSYAGLSTGERSRRACSSSSTRRAAAAWSAPSAAARCTRALSSAASPRAPAAAASAAALASAASAVARACRAAASCQPASQALARAAARRRRAVRARARRAAAAAATARHAKSRRRCCPSPERRCSAADARCCRARARRCATNARQLLNVQACAQSSGSKHAHRCSPLMQHLGQNATAISDPGTIPQMSRQGCTVAARATCCCLQQAFHSLMIAHGFALMAPLKYEARPAFTLAPASGP